MSQITRVALPPGPRLPKWLQTIVFMRFWPRFVAACGRRYGKVFTIRAPTVPPMVYLADPAEIKKVFAGDPSVFHAGEANAMLGGLLGDSSVLVIDDDVHRDRRRLMLPPFHRDAVAKQAELMAEIAADEHRRLAGGPTVRGGAEDVGDHARGDPADGHRCQRSGATRRAAGRDAEAAQRRSMGVAGDRDARNCSAAVRGERCGIASKKPTGCSTPRSPNAAPILTWTSAPTCWRCWCGATDEDGRTLSDRELRDQLMTLLVAGPRHHRDRAVVGAGAADPPPGHPRQSGRRRPMPRMRQATSISTRWPRRRCGSARWCPTWAGC